MLTKMDSSSLNKNEFEQNKFVCIGCHNIFVIFYVHFMYELESVKRKGK